jgi:hypothetical protein
MFMGLLINFVSALLIWVGLGLIVLDFPFISEELTDKSDRDYRKFGSI